MKKQLLIIATLDTKGRETAGYHFEHLIKEKNRAIAIKAVQEGGALLTKRLFEEMDLHISEPAFALRAVEVLNNLIRLSGIKSK
jgi:uncharacterized protein (UPF0261 family)